METSKYNDGWNAWGEMIDNSPAPIHRRRIMKNIIGKLEFNSILDIGCGNGRFLSEITGNDISIDAAGIDISDKVVECNKTRYPRMQFYCADIQKSAFAKQFDVVVCSEVLEHVEEIRETISNIAKMAKRYLVITVPSGPVFAIDKEMGHVRHFSVNMISSLLAENGFRVVELFRWGFPFHTLYKLLINLFPSYFMSNYAEKQYNKIQMAVSKCIEFLFYANIKYLGWQIFALAEKDNTNG